MQQPTTPSAHAIDYAPPRRRAWLTRRRVMLALLLVAAGVSSWIVLPLVWQRAELLKDQRRLAAGADQPVHIMAPSGDAVFLSAHKQKEYAVRALSQPPRFGWQPIFAGARGAEGSDNPLVLIEAQLDHRRNELALSWQVITPATWTRHAQVINSGILGPAPLPFDEGQVILLRGEPPDPLSPSLIRLTAEASDPDPPAPDGSYMLARSRPGSGGAGPMEPPNPPTRRAHITLYLMPDNTLRVDWPDAAEDIPAPE